MLIDDSGQLLTKQYQLSKGNPIEDAKQLLAKIKAFVHDQGATLDVLGFGATGYAADVLQDARVVHRHVARTDEHVVDLAVWRVRGPGATAHRALPAREQRHHAGAPQVAVADDDRRRARRRELARESAQLRRRPVGQA